MLSVDQKRRCVDRLRQRIHDLHAFDPQKVQKRYRIPEVMALETAIDEALSAAFGHGTVEYDRYSDAATLDHGPHIARMGPGFGPEPDYDAQDAYEARRYLAEGKEQSIAFLQQAIRTLEDEIADQQRDDESIVPKPAPKSGHVGRKVFVVHGHDEAAREAMARFLEKLELEAIILQEQPDQGFTIIEKFETYANQVSFAVVILTPDDLASDGSVQATRARQNVIFELGYFVGKLGRGGACLLRKGTVEIPSDLYGVIYTDMDAAGGWKIKLVQELKAAGLTFDANKVWS
jgi:predicted nucleotide-binding protein